MCISVCVFLSGDDDPLFHCGFFFKLLTCAWSQSLSACPLIRREGGDGGGPECSHGRTMRLDQCTEMPAFFSFCFNLSSCDKVFNVPLIVKCVS